VTPEKMEIGARLDERKYYSSDQILWGRLKRVVYLCAILETEIWAYQVSQVVYECTRVCCAGNDGESER